MGKVIRIRVRPGASTRGPANVIQLAVPPRLRLKLRSATIVPLGRATTTKPKEEETDA